MQGQQQPLTSRVDLRRKPDGDSRGVSERRGGDDAAVSHAVQLHVRDMGQDVRKPRGPPKGPSGVHRSVDGKLHGFWYAFGAYDGFTLWEAPDNVVSGQPRLKNPFRHRHVAHLHVKSRTPAPEGPTPATPRQHGNTASQGQGHTRHGEGAERLGRSSRDRPPARLCLVHAVQARCDACRCVSALRAASAERRPDGASRRRPHDTQEVAGSSPASLGCQAPATGSGCRSRAPLRRSASRPRTRSRAVPAEPAFRPAANSTTTTGEQGGGRPTTSRRCCKSARWIACFCRVARVRIVTIVTGDGGERP